jgi:hypothetical protein
MVSLKYSSFKYSLASLIILVVILFPSILFAVESGWFRYSKGYYKPFVKVSNYRNKEALFITSNGNIYLGKCSLDSVYGNTCYMITSKKFKNIDGKITFIVIKLLRNYPPQLESVGIVNSFNVKLKE